MWWMLWRIVEGVMREYNGGRVRVGFWGNDIWVDIWEESSRELGIEWGGV